MDYVNLPQDTNDQSLSKRHTPRSVAQQLQHRSTLLCQRPEHPLQRAHKMEGTTAKTHTVLTREQALHTQLSNPHDDPTKQGL